MGTRKKKYDPKRTALLDAAVAADCVCEKCYSRLKRAFNRHEKERQRAKRAYKALARYDLEQEAKIDEGGQ